MSNSLNQLDAVEIKVTIKPEQIKQAENVFDLKKDEAQKCKIYFCEDMQAFHSTGTLHLLDHGIILRLRQTKDASDDSTVKLRPVSSQIATEWRGLERFKLEGDWVGDRKVESASFTVEQQQDEIESVIEGERSLDKLFSKEQERFLRTSALIEINLSSLQVLGPVQALRWQPKHIDAFPYSIRSEQWHLPDDRQLLELSIRVKPEQAQKAQAEFMQLLEENMLDSTGIQETKTRMVLELLAEKFLS
jgi:hypothetical protein